MFATHPPLKERIKQIDPGWNGRFISPKSVTNESSEIIKEKSQPVAGMAVTAAILTAAEAMEKIGTLNETSIEYAQQLILNIPDTLKTAAQSAYSARALIYSLLIREQKNKDKAWQLLNEHADETMPPLTEELMNESLKLDERIILPLLELCINALRELSENQYKQFKHTVNTIITADKTINLNEWVIQRLVLQQLDEHFSLRKPAKAKHAYLGAVKKDAETLLSLIAYVEHKDNDMLAKQVFELGKKEIGAHAFNIVPKEELSLSTLNTSLDQLMQLKPLLKSKILKACAALLWPMVKQREKVLSYSEQFPVV